MLDAPAAIQQAELAMYEAKRADHPDAGRLSIAVNVSPVQFHQADFVDSVREVLGATGADPRRLVLEVTETLFLKDPLVARDTMETLSARGIRFALDDFGTGYTSLSYLKRLPSLPGLPLCPPRSGRRALPSGKKRLAIEHLRR